MSFRRLLRSLQAGTPDPFLAFRAQLPLEDAATRCAALLLLLLNDGDDDGGLDLELKIAAPGPYTATLDCVGKDVLIETARGSGSAREIERAAHDAIRAATPRSWALPVGPLVTPTWCRAEVAKDGAKSIPRGKVLKIAVIRPSSAHARLAASALLGRDERTGPGRLARLWGLIPDAATPPEPTIPRTPL